MLYYMRNYARDSRTSYVHRDEIGAVSMRRKIALLAILLMLVTVGVADSSNRALQVLAKQPQDNIVIMIDPGHGGENLGGQPEGYDEKEITLKTAEAMRLELEKYDGVTVYMTRTEDVELSLKERAELADAVEADFLISLHYNMSAAHEFYGAEVWTQSVGSNYAKGQTLGKVILDEFADRFPDLYNRGIKVRLGKNRADYYGILRESTKKGIPAIIVEHCYMDHDKDADFCDMDTDYALFGKADATAVAKYFGLKSAELKTDYSESVPKQIAIPRKIMRQDVTPPEVTEVEIAYQDTKEGMLGLRIKAEDEESGILYFSCSVDGGQTWSMLQRWNASGKVHRVKVPGKFYANSRTVIVRSYNGYDVMTESNPVSY